jgi:hypothetical protein
VTAQHVAVAREHELAEQLGEPATARAVDGNDLLQAAALEAHALAATEIDTEWWTAWFRYFGAATSTYDARVACRHNLAALLELGRHVARTRDVTGAIASTKAALATPEEQEAATRNAACVQRGQEQQSVQAARMFGHGVRAVS